MTVPVRHPLTAAAPTRPPMTLLDMAFIPDAEVGLDGEPVGDRWERGFTWLPRLCGGVAGRNLCAPYAQVDYRTATGSGKRSHQPVILVAENECQSTFGTIAAPLNGWDYENQTADEQLYACEPAAVEQELWDGTLARAALAAGDATFADNLWLTQLGVATEVTSSAVSINRGIELLEQFLADSGCGGQGMIHILPQLVPRVGVRFNGPRQMMTNWGNFLVPGAGYTGNGPSVTVAGARTVTDGHTNSNTTVTSATAAFTTADVGAAITGAGIPAGTTITARGSATSVTISAEATATATGVTLTITGGAPATPDAGTAWIYATSRVTYRAGQIQHATSEPAQAIDRSTNTIVVTAQRSTAAVWDACTVGAALVTLPA